MMEITYSSISSHFGGDGQLRCPTQQYESRVTRAATKYFRSWDMQQIKIEKVRRSLVYRALHEGNFISVDISVKQDTSVSVTFNVPSVSSICNDIVHLRIEPTDTGATVSFSFGQIDPTQYSRLPDIVVPTGVSLVDHAYAARIAFLVDSADVDHTGFFGYFQHDPYLSCGDNRILIANITQQLVDARVHK